MSLYNLNHKATYPRLKFAPAGGAVMVHNETEEKALGHGWTDTDPEAAAPVPADETPAAKRKGKK